MPQQLVLVCMFFGQLHVIRAVTTTASAALCYFILSPMRCVTLLLTRAFLSPVSPLSCLETFATTAIVSSKAMVRKVPFIQSTPCSGHVSPLTSVIIPSILSVTFGVFYADVCKVLGIEISE